MKRTYQVEGTNLTRTSKTHIYTHAAVMIDESGLPRKIVSCSGSHLGADRNAKSAYPRTYGEGGINVLPLVDITKR